MLYLSQFLRKMIDGLVLYVSHYYLTKYPPINCWSGDIFFLLPHQYVCNAISFYFVQHKRFLSECREKDPDVIFIGDCVLETLQHTQTWNQYFAPLHSLNFSIYSDQTQNTLWRIQNGVLDNVKPKVRICVV